MSGGESALDLAARRLEQAVHVLEQRLALRLKSAGDAVGGLFDQDRAKLASELDEARARERALEAAGAEASAANFGAGDSSRKAAGREESASEARREGGACGSASEAGGGATERVRARARARERLARREDHGHGDDLVRVVAQRLDEGVHGGGRETEGSRGA